MEIKTSLDSDINIFEIVGRLDGSTAPQAQETLQSEIVDNIKMVIDMSQCDYISSAGLRVLLVLAKSLKAKEGHGVLSGLIPEVKDVMEMTGFDKMFISYSSMTEALIALKEGLV